MPKGVKTSKQLKERVLEAFHNGERQAEISRRFVIPRYTVCRILQNYQERGHLDDILKTGRPRKSSLTTDRLIKRISQNDPWKSAPRIKSEIENLNLSTRSVQRRLVEAKLFGKRPARKSLISRKNKTARLEFAREHVGWNRKDWQKFYSATKQNMIYLNQTG
jgi:transposase